jgi:hypothetical protein
MQLRLVASLNRRRVRNSPDALAADTSDTRAAPACVLLVVGQLRERQLPAPRGDGAGAVDHTMGCGGIERCPAAVRAVLPMRSQRGDPSAPGLGRQPSRPAAVSRRPPRRRGVEPETDSQTAASAWLVPGPAEDARGRPAASYAARRAVCLFPACEQLARHGRGTDTQSQLPGDRPVVGQAARGIADALLHSGDLA